MRNLSLLPGSLIVCILAIACTTTPRNIKDANESARTGETPAEDRRNDFGAEYGPIATFDLRPGDCFDADAPSFELGQVLRVPCEGYHTHRVLTNVFIDEDGGWPGDDFFQAEAIVLCDVTTEAVIYPTADSWFVGDRTILCLEGF